MTKQKNHGMTEANFVYRRLVVVNYVVYVIYYIVIIYIPLFESFSFDGFGMFILSTLLSIDIWHKNSCKELFACEGCTSSCWDW